jgi:hypothetical protein
VIAPGVFAAEFLIVQLETLVGATVAVAAFLLAGTLASTLLVLWHHLSARTSLKSTASAPVAATVECVSRPGVSFTG